MMTLEGGQRSRDDPEIAFDNKQGGTTTYT